jgi:hypothetical protein
MRRFALAKRELNIFCREFSRNFTPVKKDCTMTQMDVDTKESCRAGENSSPVTTTETRRQPADLTPTIKNGFINEFQGVKLPDERTMEDLVRELEELKQEEKKILETFFNLYAEHQKMVLEYKGCLVQLKKMKPCAIKAAELLAQMTERCRLMDLDGNEPEGNQIPPAKDKKEGNSGGKM